MNKVKLKLPFPRISNGRENFVRLDRSILLHREEKKKENGVDDRGVNGTIMNVVAIFSIFRKLLPPSLPSRPYASGENIFSFSLVPPRKERSPRVVLQLHGCETVLARCTSAQ